MAQQGPQALAPDSLGSNSSFAPTGSGILGKFPNLSVPLRPRLENQGHGDGSRAHLGTHHENSGSCCV